MAKPCSEQPSSDAFLSPAEVVDTEVGDNSLWTGESSSDFALSSNDDSGGSIGLAGGMSGVGQEDGRGSALQLRLDKNLAVQLVMTFGLMQVPIDCNAEGPCAILSCYFSLKCYF